MPNKYEVQVEELKEIHSLPGGWTSPDLIRLLERLDFDGADSLAPEELMDMASLALSDLEPEAAAALLLELRLGEQLRPGQRQNMAEEMKDERLWEEYADLSCHEELFNIATMLYATFPSRFPEPDVTRLSLTIRALNADSEVALRSPTASFLGRGERNTLRRLFDEQIDGHRFPEADDLIWRFEPGTFDAAERSLPVTMYISLHWVEELRGVDGFESSAYADPENKP